MPVQEKILIFRSWKSDFNRDDILNALNIYSDAELEGIREHGFNGIWLRGRFRELVPSSIFPEFGLDSGRYTDCLNRLIERAAHHDIGVYLYVNEPAGFPADDEFWLRHPEVKGSISLLPHHDCEQESDENYYSFCTSTDQVKIFLKESASELLSRVERLSGIITITASEYQTHCYAHIDCLSQSKGEALGYFYPIDEMSCPRCKGRDPIDIVAEINNIIYTGIVEAGSSTKLIAWNWSWNLYEPDPQKSIISKLLKDIIVMADFERGDTGLMHGKSQIIEEYSLMHIGPSPRARYLFEQRSVHGHAAMAKLQIGTTHELATVPNLPVIFNVWEKIKYLINHECEGVMACWNFGNMLTLNTYLTGRGLQSDKSDDMDRVLDRLLHAYFPRLDDDDINELKIAWSTFAEASHHYPFNMSILYTGVINYALGYWLPPRRIKGDRKAGRAWLMDQRGDDLSDSFSEWSLPDIINALEALAKKWNQGLELYHKVFKDKTDQHSMEEYSSAVIAGCCFTSAWHVYRLYALCASWQDSFMRDYLDLCNKELANCNKALPFLSRDKRLGFHCECQGYQFDEQIVQQKVDKLHAVVSDKTTGCKYDAGSS